MRSRFVARRLRRRLSGMHGPLAPLGCSDRDHRDEQKHARNGKQKSFDDWHRG
jgi:hypothetical protein